MTSEQQQLAAIETERILPCMTCPICHKLFKNATTISECLHTFCKKCIYNKITKEELNSCPVCKVHLGCYPLQKLRPDPYWQDIRALLFNPSTRIASNEPKSGPSNPISATIQTEEDGDVHSVPLPPRRKKKSLSSLVSQLKASNETVMNGRTKVRPKKANAWRGTTLSINEPTGNEDDRHKSSSPHLTLTKITRYQKQSFHVDEPSKQKMAQKGVEDSKVAQLEEGMADMWKPLNCLVEAADATRRGDPPVQMTVAKSGPKTIRSEEPPMNKSKSKEKRVQFKATGEGGSHPVPSGSAEPKKHFGVQGRRDIAGESGNTATNPIMVNDASTMHYGGGHPVWFSLHASDSQEGDAPLPQIPSAYLRVKNSDLPASFIKKYIVKKLNLQSEDEVEITMQGQLLPPNLRLCDLVPLWSQRAPKPPARAVVGSSAKDYVVVIDYGRKK